ncbi:hypothetical protein BX600DRAFT_468528 [Xylariales sp. PMI_506]|nr:hypothetical protein BX600DRAFT_468528 [Xylariales sp. PMI_506]
MGDRYSLKLELAAPRDRNTLYSSPFYPGDPVTGTVKFELFQEEEIHNLFIEFKGKCKTRIRNSENDHVGKIVMFRLKTILVRGSVKMQPGKYEYPFSFRFPETFNFIWSNTDNNSNSSSMFSRFGHIPLPPSSDNEDGSGLFHVYYTLRVKSPRSFQSWKDKARLYLTSWRTELNPDPKVTVYKSWDSYDISFKGDGEHGTVRPLGKREAMKKVFGHSHDIGSLKFTLSAKAPTVMVYGKPYTLDVSITTLATEGNTASLPEFYLKHYSVSLKKISTVRTAGMLADHITHLDSHLPMSGGSAKLILPVDTAPRELHNVIRWPVFYSAPPNFISGVCNMSYGLELKATIACLDKEFNFKINWSNVVIHSGRMEPGVEEAIRTIEGDGGRVYLGNEGGIGELPQYETLM